MHLPPMAALKALYFKAFKPLIVHARPCAAVCSPPSAGGERRRHSWSSIFPDWNLNGTAPCNGSNVCFLFYKAELFPILCPAAGLRLGNICRLGNGKYSEHRHKFPSHCPAADSSVCHCCSTDGSTLECAGTDDNRSGVSVSPINHPLLIWI